ncbi:MAG: Ni/Fe hydrogenase subunit alpha [Cyanobacteria bacterium SZAS TMP-1]|nr:Ni/Fe hydrogenase subunit alpha [Cyanobacteria bacterium SZAS TMP-1]
MEIDPVTRIEGHSKITIHLDDNGSVEEARFHVTQLRGFEKFAEGRPFHEMPSLMARICGICPVSHLVASAKACDMLMSVRIPPTAVKLRRIINLAQIAQSHALSFFYLSSPDLLLGMDSSPDTRNIVGVARENPSLARNGIYLRALGQEIIELLGGKKIHPGWVVAGGVSHPLSAENRDYILQKLPQAMQIAEDTLAWYNAQLEKFSEEISVFANFPGLYMSLVGAHGELETYDGYLRLADENGQAVVDKLPPEQYKTIIAEAISTHSYLKSPYYKPMGYPAGMYRVGPLARLHLASHCGTPRADKAFALFQQLDHKSAFHYHLARLIEIVYAFEMIEQLLRSDDILDSHVRAFADANAHEGFGISEAPRGTLMHHYKIDDNGLITYADLIIATGHNNLAMNRGITQAAKHYIKSDKLSDGILNRIEAVIRTFDPCLSCSTHAIGQMPLDIQLLDAQGKLLDQAKR